MEFQPQMTATSQESPVPGHISERLVHTVPTMGPRSPETKSNVDVAPAALVFILTVATGAELNKVVRSPINEQVVNVITAEEIAEANLTEQEMTAILLYASDARFVQAYRNQEIDPRALVTSVLNEFLLVRDRARGELNIQEMMEIVDENFSSRPANLLHVVSDEGRAVLLDVPSAVVFAASLGEHQAFEHVGEVLVNAGAAGDVERIFTTINEYQTHHGEAPFEFNVPVFVDTRLALRNLGTDLRRLQETLKSLAEGSIQREVSRLEEMIKRLLREIERITKEIESNLTGQIQVNAQQLHLQSEVLFLQLLVASQVRKSQVSALT